MTGTGDRVDRELDIPLMANHGTVKNIVQDLKEGESVTLEVHPEDASNLIDQLEWQLENDRRVTKLVDDYTEDKEATA